MPTAYIKKLSKEKGISVNQLEKYWDEAKELAKKEGHEKDYAYITGIFKKIISKKDKKKINTNKINEITSVGNVANADGPSGKYLHRKKVKRNKNCPICQTNQFKPITDDEGDPAWICKGCFTITKRKERNKRILDD